jgi:Fe-S cluster biosynthesis and repair protein YggX
MNIFQTEILLLLILICFLLSNSHPDSSIHSSGIGIDAFKRMFNRECESELKLLESAHGADAASDVWRKSTELSWSHRNSTQTFLVCNENPQMSGFQRRILLQRALSKCLSNESNLHLKAILEDTFFNDDHMTCAYLHADINIARCIIQLGVQITNSIFRVQPLLPMMKIATGTVFTVESLPTDTFHFTVTMEIFGNGYDLNEIHETKIVDILMAKEHPISRLQLLDTFPFTGTLIECSNNVTCWDRPDECRYDVINTSATLTLGNLTMLNSVQIEGHCLRRKNLVVQVLSGLAHAASYSNIRYIEVQSN